MKYALTIFLILVSVWLLGSGVYTTQMITLGLLSCLAVTLLCVRLKVVDSEAQPVQLGLRPLAYLPWLFREIALANWDLARRLLSPTMAIRPQLIRVRASQKSDVAQVLYANSITLTPGTVTLELEEGELLVHALTDEAADQLRGGEMDRRVRAVEGSA